MINKEKISSSITKRRKMANKEKGITLIALVVTIVVLLILAGISINTILGDDGIITKAKEAAQKTQKADQEANKDLYDLSNELGEMLEDAPKQSIIKVSIENKTEPYKDNLYSVNQELKYEITITNEGDATEKNIRLESTITDYDGAEKHPYDLGNEYTLYTNEGYINIAELAPKESKKFTTKWQTEDGGKITNTVKVLDTFNNVKDTNAIETIVTAGYNGVEFGELNDVEYNGKEQKLTPVVTDRYGNRLVEGEDYLVSYSEDCINAGAVVVTITGLSPYYSIDPDDPEGIGAGGIVELIYYITPKSVVITSGSKSKYYDGIPLTCDEYTIEGLVEGDKIEVHMKGILEKPGMSTNTFTYEFIPPTLASNYYVYEDYGILELTPQPA